jgi:hypothetical protein
MKKKFYYLGLLLLGFSNSNRLRLKEDSQEKIVLNGFFLCPQVTSNMIKCFINGKMEKCRLKNTFIDKFMYFLRI